MDHNTKHKIAHGIAHGMHMAHKTEAGKKIVHSALIAGTAALPIVGPVVASVAVVGAIGWGLSKLFKK